MSHRSLLARATEGTDAPTPGYLYVDLAKIASSNLTACQDMANYLTRRLAAKQNPNIKFKCCKTLAKLCDAVPRNNFRRCVAQDHEGIRAIKEAMNFRGMPDPVRGDEPNQKVRIAAKEALDAVYRETPSSMETSSIGGTPASASYYSNPNASTSSSMQGIGNPRFSDPRLDPRYNGTQPQGIQGVVREVGEVIGGMIRDPLARNIEPPPPRQGHAELPRYGGPQNGAVRTNYLYTNRKSSGLLCLSTFEGVLTFSLIFLTNYVVRTSSPGISRTQSPNRRRMDHGIQSRTCCHSSR